MFFFFSSHLSLYKRIDSMKILHTSDWHLGINFKGCDAEADQRFFIRQIKDIIKAQSIDLIIIAGDIFDISVAGAEAIRLYDEAISDICGTLKCKAAIIAGNHDGAERLAQCRRLLADSGLYLCGSLTKEAIIIREDNAEIFLLPWISTDKVRAVYRDRAEEIDSLYKAYKIVSDDYRSRFTPGLKHIIAAHAFIVNSETSVSDRAAEVGFASAVGADIFAGFDYAALGHIHKPQDIGTNIRYAGTPMPYSFGKEEKQEKSVTVIDTSDMSRTIIPLKLLHKRTTLKGTYDELLAADYPEDVIGGYTKLIVTDRQLGLETMSYLRDRYVHPIEISGKLMETDGARASISIEELEAKAHDPIEIFRQFCLDNFGEEPSEHYKELFKAAVQEAKEEDR